MPTPPPPRDAVDEIVTQWNRERPDLDTSSIEVIGRLSRISAAIDRSMAAHFAQHGIQAGWYDVLASLRRSGGECELTPSELLATMMLTSGAITKRIDKLESIGLVERRADPSDGRGVRVRLTPAGRERVDAVTVTHLANQRMLLETLTAREQQQLAALLHTVGSGLDLDG